MVSRSGMDGENLDGESGSAWACRHPPFQITLGTMGLPASITQSK